MFEQIEKMMKGADQMQAAAEKRHQVQLEALDRQEKLLIDIRELLRLLVKK